MAVIITSTIVGNTVLIIGQSFDQNDNVVNVDTGTAQLTIARGHSTIIGPVTPTNTALGTYQYNWDTTSVMRGVYTIIWQHTVNGIKVKEQQTLTLT